MDRRAFLRKGSIVGAGVLTASMLNRLPQAWGSGVCHIGSTAQQRSGQTQQEALQQLEQLVGRRFSTVHCRLAWDTPLVNSYTTWGVNGGRTPILSWFARRPDRTLIGFRSIANGNHDRWITDQARSLRDAGWSGYLCFHKEPEDETNPTDWKAAYARVRQIFKNVGVTNFKWVVCLIASTYTKGEAGLWLPNADWDLLGADAANRYACKGIPWKPFTTLFGPAREFARARGRNLYIAEFATVEGEAGRKAQWFDQARAAIQSWPEVVGVSHLNEKSDCTYWVDTSQSALDAFRGMALDPYFR